MNLRERVATFEPDLVVIYHGINDLSLDSIEAAEARGLFSGRAEEPSWLARHSLAWYLVEKNLLGLGVQQVVISPNKMLQV